MKGGIGWNRGFSRPIRVLFDVSVSRNWFKTVSNLYKNLYILFIYKSLYKNGRFKRIIFSKYTTNQSENNDIQESQRKLGLLLLSFEFNNFSFLINIIDNTINTSVSYD